MDLNKKIDNLISIVAKIAHLDEEELKKIVEDERGNSFLPTETKKLEK